MNQTVLNSALHGASSRLLALAAAGLALCGCVAVEPEWENDLRQSSWGLISVELDRSQLDNRGVLPVFDPLPPGQRSLRPVIRGTLTFDARGTGVCKVTATEPTSAGSRPFTYTLVDFVGRLEDEGERFLPIRRPDNVYLGQATVVHILGREQDGRVVVLQAATGDKLLPYVYRFRRASNLNRPVPAPTL